MGRVRVYLVTVVAASCGGPYPAELVLVDASLEEAESVVAVAAEESEAVLGADCVIGVWYVLVASWVVEEVIVGAVLEDMLAVVSLHNVELEANGWDELDNERVKLRAYDVVTDITEDPLPRQLVAVWFPTAPAEASPI